MAAKWLLECQEQHINYEVKKRAERGANVAFRHN